MSANPHIENIGWHTFIIYAILNASFIVMVFVFYPETKGISVEDIPLLFHKKGFTGGVFSSKGGRTVIPGQHAQEARVDEKVDLGTSMMEGDHMAEVGKKA